MKLHFTTLYGRTVLNWRVNHKVDGTTLWVKAPVVVVDKQGEAQKWIKCLTLRMFLHQTMQEFQCVYDAIARHWWQ